MQKKLYRSPKDGILLGVASGLGHYFDKDPVLVRLIFVVLAFITKGWPILIAYAVLFFIIPVDPAQEKVETSQQPKDVTASEPEQPKEEIREDAEEEKMDSTQNM